MERTAITVDEDLLARFEVYVKRNGYTNRTAAFRGLDGDGNGHPPGLLEDQGEGHHGAFLEWAAQADEHDVKADLLELVTISQGPFPSRHG